ncbi:gamma-2-syntrophin isoform X12 [Macaca fascicularis]|uniref:gamma-2-syntrophin isoform X12 n=1 Tax=Macaca fascicularis TaxID=9541 RepID=UPI003D1597B6
MSTEGPPPPAAPRGRPGCLLVPARERLLWVQAVVRTGASPLQPSGAQAGSELAGVSLARCVARPRQVLGALGHSGSRWDANWTKTAVALLYDEESENAYDVRLKLTKEVLTIQKQDVICVGGSHQGRNHRTVTLRRQAVGGLGLSIKGGSEHNVPVVISKIFKDQAADQTGMLFVGDAVLQVNGINVENATHEEVVHLLRNAGNEVTITVEYLREAPAFLKLPLGSPGPSSDHSSGASSPLFDSGLHLNGNSSNTETRLKQKENLQLPGAWDSHPPPSEAWAVREPAAPWGTGLMPSSLRSLNSDSHRVTCELHPLGNSSSTEALVHEKCRIL